MENYSLDQSEADTVLFSAYAALHESGYTGPVVINPAADVTAAVISWQLPGMLNQEEARDRLMPWPGD